MPDNDPFNEGITAAATALVNEAGDAFFDNAERFTCSEIEAVAHLVRAVGQDWADSLVEAHAVGDDEGDSHYRPDGPSVSNDHFNRRAD